MNMNYAFSTTFDFVVLTCPLIPVCFGVAVMIFCFSITTVMSVAAPRHTNMINVLF